MQQSCSKHNFPLLKQNENNSVTGGELRYSSIEFLGLVTSNLEMFQGGVRWGEVMSSGELTDGIDLILNMFSDDGWGF